MREILQQKVSVDQLKRKASLYVRQSSLRQLMDNTVSGSLGIVIPPSIPMILYCLVMNVSVAEMFMAGAMPGLLIGLALIGYTYVIAKRHNWRIEKKASIKEILRTINGGSGRCFFPLSSWEGFIPEFSPPRKRRR